MYYIHICLPSQAVSSQRVGRCLCIPITESLVPKQSLVHSWRSKGRSLNVKPLQIDKGKLTTAPGSQAWAFGRRSVSHAHRSRLLRAHPALGLSLACPSSPHSPPCPHPWIFCWAALLSSTSFWLVSSRSRAVRSSCSYTLVCCSFTCRSVSSCLVRYWGRQGGRGLGKNVSAWALLPLLGKSSLWGFHVQQTTG